MSHTRAGQGFAATLSLHVYRDLPVALGSFMEDKQNHFRFGAGDGMIFTNAAAKAIVPRLRTPDGPFTRDNDVTLARCARKMSLDWPEPYSVFFQ